MGEESEERKFQFLRNGDAEPSDLDWNKGVESARQAISEAMNARNIAFLLGAGCSSLTKDKKELGIATMARLAKEFCEETLDARAGGFYGDPPVVGAAPAPWRLTKGELDYLDALGIDLAKDYSRNLERLMEVLFAQRFVLRQSENPALHPYRAVLDGIIKKVQDFLWTRVTRGAFATEGDTTVRDLYERFYKKLVLRDRSLPRPWVFTTNYDHFSELAMDRLGIPYANGFSGVVERRFNPAIFRYALAEQLDVASRKWTAVDAFVYLCKIARLGHLDRGRSWPVPDQGGLAARVHEPDADLSDAGEAELLARLALRGPVPGISVPDRARAERSHHGGLRLR